MVADSDPISVPTAWQSPGEVFTGQDVRPRRLQRFNHLNPASIEAWVVKARAYLDERGCLEAIDSPQINDAAAFTAENPLNSSGERMPPEEMAAAYKMYVEGKHAACDDFNPGG